MTVKNFVLTTLSQNPEYFEEVIGLIEEEFHYNAQQHYEQDFAPLMDPLNFENCFLYIDQNTNTVVAHLAVSLRTMIKSNIEMPVALIGGIVTHKEHRGEKLFKNLMDHAINLYKEKVSLFILWSDIEGLYEKFYFYRSGGLIESGKKDFSSNERPMGYEKTTFSNLSEKEFQAIVNLYHSFNEQYFFTIKRSDKDWSIIREMNSIDLYIKKNSINEIVKYFCINKGKDLSNIIHEISCREIEQYQELLNELSSFKMWLPETEAAKINETEMFYTAFVRLGSLSLLNSFFQKISKHTLSISEMNNELVSFNFSAKDYQVNHRDFLQYFLGPKPLEEFADFKLSLYISGVDSI
ncbi:MAG: GNAT family N-acetyltransferase [Bacteriovorax sp.]|nr:GNAT family N-acetyltransferase [Bacteriovorax sp.]